jgi:hypothetical protein
MYAENFSAASLKLPQPRPYVVQKEAI